MWAMAERYAVKYRITPSAALGKLSRVEEFIAEEMSQGNRLCFKDFFVGLKMTGRFERANETYSHDDNPIHVVMTPKESLHKVTRVLEPVCETARTKLWISCIAHHRITGEAPTRMDVICLDGGLTTMNAFQSWSNRCSDHCRDSNLRPATIYDTIHHIRLGLGFGRCVIAVFDLTSWCAGWCIGSRHIGVTRNEMRQKMKVKLLAAGAALLASCFSASATDVVTPWWNTPEVIAITEFKCSGDGGAFNVANDRDFTYYAAVGRMAGGTYGYFDMVDLLAGNAMPSFTLTDETDKLRGSAVSSKLGKQLVGSYERKTIRSIPLDAEEAIFEGEGANSFLIENDLDIIPDFFRLSSDSDHLYCSAQGSEYRTNVYKFAVGDLSKSGVGLTKVAVWNLGKRVRGSAMAQINGKDIYFALLDGTKGIVAIDMSDNASVPQTIISESLMAEAFLMGGSYGSIYVVKPDTAEPRLYVLPHGDHTFGDIKAFALASDGLSLKSTTPVATCPVATITALGMNPAGENGATIVVSEDESTALISCCQKIYVLKHEVPKTLVVDAVGGSCVENEGVYTFTPNSGYVFSSLYENGSVAVASKYVVNPDTGIVTYTPGKLTTDTRTVIAAKAVKTVPANKWWESPKVVAVSDMGVNTINGGTFHPGLDETGTYAGMTIGIDGKYMAPTYTWASMVDAGAQPVNSAAYVNFTNGLRGSAVSSALNVNLVGGGNVSSNMYSFPLNTADLVLGENSFVIENDKGSHIDNYFFSADKQFLYASELVYDTTKKEYVSGSKLNKWRVLNGLKTSGTNLILSAELHDFTNSVNCAAFATINGHEIYYALVGAECIRAYDITAGQEYTVISAEEFAKLDTRKTKDCSFGSLAISGLDAGTPRLTILLSGKNSSAYLDTLSVYSLDADGVSNATQVKSFNYDEMKAFGIGIATGQGASALVSDDEGELVLGMSYSAKAQLFAVKYVAKYLVDFSTQYGTAPDSQIVFANEKLTAPVAPKATGYTLTGWYTNLESGVSWNFDTDVVTSTMTLKAKWEKVIHQIALFAVDGKGTVTLDQSGGVESGGTISGNVTDVASGYIPYVFVDGTLAKTGAGAFVGTANDSAKVIVTYVKENAWYLQPFVKSHAFLHTMSHNSSYMGNCAISPDEKSFFTALSIQHYNSGYGQLNGVYQFSTSGLKDTIGVYLEEPENRQLGSNKGGYLVSGSEGFMSVIPLTDYLVTGAQQGGQGGNGNSMVYPIGGDWGGVDESEKKIDADDRYLIDSDFSDVNNGTVGTFGTIGLQWLLSGIQSTDGKYVYVGLHARGEITKAAIGERNGKLTLKKTGVFWRTTTASGTGSGTQAVGLALYNDGSNDHVYAYLADGRLVKLDETTLSGNSYANAYATSKSENSTVYDHKMIDIVNLAGKGTPYALKVIGAKEKTPRLVVQTRSGNAYVYALCTDGTLASTSPIATVLGSDLGVKNFNGLTGTDDELYAFANYGDGNDMKNHCLATVTARPANVIVRGTFTTYDGGENTEVAYGTAANVVFTAPTGKKITAVMVNGVEDKNFTADAYTFADEALVKNVYIEMTTADKTFDVTLMDGETTYYTTNIVYNTTVVKPIDPTPADGFTFKGWTNETYTTGFDFATPITADLTLFAWYEEVVGPTPVDPGKPIPSTDPVGDADKINQGGVAAKKAVMAPPTGATVTDDYYGLFSAVPGSGVVTMLLNEAGTNAVVAAEQSASTEALTAVLGSTGESAALTVSQPLTGFFYSLKQNAALESLDYREGDKNKLGGRDAISFTLDKSATSGFYQMIVTPGQVE